MINEVLEKIRIVFSIAAVDEKVIDLSLASDFRDFEDAVQYYSAIHARAGCVITRNKQDYKAEGHSGNDARGVSGRDKIVNSRVSAFPAACRRKLH